MSESKKSFFRSRNELDKSLADSRAGHFIKKHTDDLVDFLWEKTKSVKNFAGKHATKVFLIAALSSGGVYVADRLQSDKMENIIELSEAVSNNFWDLNPDFFDKSIISKPLKRETLAPGVDVIRDVGLTFYIVKRGDTKDKIREKLQKTPEFSYLSRPEYDNKIKSFNVPGKIVENKSNAKEYNNNFYIPIPLSSDVRTFSLQDFAFYARQGIYDIKDHPIYASKITQLLGQCSEDELVAAMVAFARSETAGEYTSFTSPIGDTEFHRWEEHMKAFSFSPYHILMEKNADGKTDGPWLKARKDLWFTEWQCYHPRNATALFLAYWCNKVGNKSMSDYFPITPENISKVSSTYNWDANYAIKLEPNYLHSLDVLWVKSNSWTKKRQQFDLQNVSVGGFSFERISSDEKKVYSYVIKSGWNADWVKRQFKNQYPSYSWLIEVVKKDGSAYPDNTWIKKGTKIYVKIDK
jgi:hypothetical protein